METSYLTLNDGTIAYDITGGQGPPIVLLPGAGDTRAEYRFLAPMLAADGSRVVTTDLRGHGDSSAEWGGYGVAESAGDLMALLEHLGPDTGPATVVGTSFSPAAALWAAVDRPDLIGRIVLISAHLSAAPAWQRIPLDLILRSPLAGRIWAGQYRNWHPGAPPADLEAHVAGLAAMLSDPTRRRAVRQTLTAHRDGLDARIDQLDVPTLVVMGGADSHFKDPRAEGASMAARTGGSLHVVPDAGHYPHAEYPEAVAAAVHAFLGHPQANDRQANDRQANDRQANDR